MVKYHFRNREKPLKVTKNIVTLLVALIVHSNLSSIVAQESSRSENLSVSDLISNWCDWSDQMIALRSYELCSEETGDWAGGILEVQQAIGANQHSFRNRAVYNRCGGGPESHLGLNSGQAVVGLSNKDYSTSLIEVRNGWQMTDFGPPVTLPLCIRQFASIPCREDIDGCDLKIVERSDIEITIEFVPTEPTLEKFAGSFSEIMVTRFEVTFSEANDWLPIEVQREFVGTSPDLRTTLRSKFSSWVTFKKLMYPTRIDHLIDLESEAEAIPWTTEIVSIEKQAFEESEFFLSKYGISEISETSEKPTVFNPILVWGGVFVLGALLLCLRKLM